MKVIMVRGGLVESVYSDRREKIYVFDYDATMRKWTCPVFLTSPISMLHVTFFLFLFYSYVVRFNERIKLSRNLSDL